MKPSHLSQHLPKEKELIAAAKKNPRFFAPLYAFYHPKVYRFIWSRVKQDDLAGDIAAQTFVKAIHHLPRYKITDIPLGAWLFRIAINELNQHYRDQKKQAEVPLSEAVLDRLLAEAGESRSDDGKRRKLIDGLNQLSSVEVDLIELRFFEERRFSEMGEILGISEDNAKVRTYRALKRLKTVIFSSDEEV